MLWFCVSVFFYALQVCTIYICLHKYDDDGCCMTRGSVIICFQFLFEIYQLHEN